MIEIENIEEFTMRYIFKNGSECYDCIQVEDSLVLSPDKQTVKATLKAKQNTVNLAPFDIIVTKKDDKYWIKSDFFEEVSTLYRLNIFEGDDEYILMTEFPTEVMYLHAEHV